MQSILTPVDIVRETGWTMQRVQRLCKTGKMPVKNISTGPKNARYIIERSIFESWLKNADNVPVVPAKHDRRQRLDANIKDKVIQ